MVANYSHCSYASCGHRRRSAESPGRVGEWWKTIPGDKQVLGQTEMRVRVLGDEYRFTVESQANDRWEMHQLMTEAPLIAQWAQRTYGGAPIEIIVRR